MKRQLTLAEAWRKIAEAYERKIATGDESGGLAFLGLCKAVRTLLYDGEISRGTAAEMHVAISDLLEQRKVSEGRAARPVWLAPYDAEGDALRAGLAAFLAEEAAG